MNKTERSPGLATIRNLLMVIAAMLLVAVIGVVPVVRADDATIVDSGTFKSGGTWSLDSDGILTLSGDIACDTINPQYNSWPWYSNASKIKSIVSDDVTLTGTDCSYMFYNCRNLTDLRELEEWNTSNITNMSSMFYNCSSLADVTSIAEWDVSKVQSMSYLFYECSNMTRINLDKWNTSSVTNMWSMFFGCQELMEVNVSNFDTSNVTDMGSMFYYCQSLISVDTSGWNTSKVEDMQNMFYWCSALKTIKGASSWNTSNVTNMDLMFCGCNKLIELDVSNFDTSKVTRMDRMFAGCSSLKEIDVSNFDTSQSQYLCSMFEGCSSLKNIDLSSFNTEKCITMAGMFDGCSSLETIDVSNFKTSKNTNLSYMFANCSSLKKLNLSNFDTSNVTRFSNMFQNCSSLTELNLSSFDTSKATHLNCMFDGCTNLSELDLSNFNTTNAQTMTAMFEDCANLKKIDISNFNTSNVTNMDHMFANCTALQLPDMSGWDTSNVTTMQAMFSNCSASNSIKGPTEWNTEKLTDTYHMFFGCSLSDIEFRNGNISVENKNATITGKFQENINVDLTRLEKDASDLPHATTAKTNNVELVGNINRFFDGFFNLETLDLSDVDVSKTISLTNAFSNCYALEEGTFPGNGTWSLDNNGTLTLSGMISWPAADADSWPWATRRQEITKVVINEGTKIVGSAAYLFYNCNNLETINGLNNLDVSGLTSSKSMFENCYALNNLNSLTNWAVTNIDDMSRMFAWCTSASQNMSSSDLIRTWKIPSSAATADMFLGWENSKNISVESFSVKLVNDTDYKYDEDSKKYYVSNESHWHYRQNGHKICPDYLTPIYGVDISLSGKDTENYDVGSIQIRIPASPFTDRDGNRTVASVNWSIPEAPGISALTPFNYSYDATSDEYIITNTAPMSAASEIAFEFPYTSPYCVSNVRDNSKTDDFYAKVTITNGTESVAMCNNAPGIYTITTSSFANHNIYPGIQKIYSEGDLLYIKYFILLDTKIAQASKLKFIVTSEAGYPVLNDSDYYDYREDVYDNSFSYYYYFNVAYPLTDELKDGNKHKLDVKISGELIGLDDAYDSFASNYDYEYQYKQFTLGDINNIEKEQGRWTCGTVDYLTVGTDSLVSYRIKGTANNYSSTLEGDGSNPYNYGKKSWSFTICDDTLSLSDDFSNLLTADDYYIESVELTSQAYEYVETGTGWEVKETTNYPYLKLYGKTESGEWVLIQNKPSNIASCPSFPSGYCGFKYECDSNLYEFTFSIEVKVMIKPSKLILSNIHDDMSYLRVYNRANLTTFTNTHTVISELSDYWYNDLTRYGASSGFGKSLYQKTTNTELQRFELAYSVTNYLVYSYTDADTFEKLIENGIIKSRDEETFYDLLPLGTILDKNSVVFNVVGKQDTPNDMSTDVREIENFNGTGRTLAIFHASRKDNLNGFKTGFSVKYTLYYPFESVLDYGHTVKNDVICDYGSVAWFCNPASTWVTDMSTYFANTDESRYRVGSASTTVAVGSAVSLELSKSVRAEDNTTYTQGHTGDVSVKDSEDYEYLLRFGSAADTTTSNIILFDSLENYMLEDGTRSGWKGTLQSIDLTQPRLKGIAPVVYYSIIENLSIEDHHDIADNSVWKKLTDDTDLSTVKAVAIDLRKKTDGTDYELPEKQTIRVTLNMKAPTEDIFAKAVSAKTRAYNNVYLSNTLTTSTGYKADYFVHYDYTEVCLENTAPDAIQIKLSALKNLTDAGNSGRSLAADEFSFNLKDSSGNVLDTVKNDKDGNVVFKEIEFEEEGTYTYTIEEVLPTGGTYSEDKKKYVKDNITYDLNPITVSIVVTVNDNNELVATKQ